MPHNRIYSPISNIQWSDAEKSVARNAFKKAYGRECDGILAKLKKMTAKASSPQDIWEIHDYLSQERKQTDEKYDYRYSVLVFVFARLIHEGWLREDELQGIHENKIKRIKTEISLLAS